MKYAEKVEHSTAKIGGRFVDYRSDTGSWIFEVKYSVHIINGRILYMGFFHAMKLVVNS